MSGVRKLVISVEHVVTDFYAIDLPEALRDTVEKAEAESTFHGRTERDQLMGTLEKILDPAWVVRSGEKVTNTGTLSSRDILRITSCRSYMLPTVPGKEQRG